MSTCLHILVSNRTPPDSSSKPNTNAILAPILRPNSISKQLIDSLSRRARCSIRAGTEALALERQGAGTAFRCLWRVIEGRGVGVSGKRRAVSLCKAERSVGAYEGALTSGDGGVQGEGLGGGIVGENGCGVVFRAIDWWSGEGNMWPFPCSGKSSPRRQRLQRHALD